jgi:hypothetical protein
MPQRQSYVDAEKVKYLNQKIYEKGYVDREHLMEFLAGINTNDAQSVITEVKKWLTDLHNDPTFDKVRFPQGDIDAVIGDLDSYGRVQPDKLADYKGNSSRTLPIS